MDQNAGIIVSKGNHPQMAELFRLVKYSYLPRLMINACFRQNIWIESWFVWWNVWCFELGKGVVSAVTKRLGILPGKGF